MGRGRDFVRGGVVEMTALFLIKFLGRVMVLRYQRFRKRAFDDERVGMYSAGVLELQCISRARWQGVSTDSVHPCCLSVQFGGGSSP